MKEKKQKRETLRKAKQRLLDEMAKVEPTSQEYAKLSSELAKLTQAEDNQNGWKGQLGVGLINTLITAVASSVNIWSILRHEDKGHVLTTKAMNQVNKPR